MARTKTDARSRLWVCVVYPESLPANWLDIISEWYISCVVSPLHDRDIDADGSLKKAHYHIVMQFAGNKSLEQICELIAPLNGPLPKKINSLKAQVRYLIHYDNPDKAQYRKEDLIAFGGFDVDLYLGKTEVVRHIAMREMREFVMNNCIEYFCDLYDYADRQRPDWAELLDDSCTFAMSAFVKDFRYKLRDQAE